MIDRSRYEGHSAAPWTPNFNHRKSEGCVYIEPGIATIFREGEKMAAADAYLIADAPLLLDEIDRLEAENERLRAALTELVAHLEAMQTRAIEYLQPASGDTEMNFIGDVLEALDGPAQRRIQGSASAALKGPTDDR